MAEPFRFTCRDCPFKSDDVKAANEHGKTAGHRLVLPKPLVRSCLKLQPGSSWTACGDALSPERPAVLVEAGRRYSRARHCPQCWQALPEDARAELQSLEEVQRALDGQASTAAALSRAVQATYEAVRAGIPGLREDVADRLAALQDVSQCLAEVRGHLYELGLVVATARKPREEARHG